MDIDTKIDDDGSEGLRNDVIMKTTWAETIVGRGVVILPSQTTTETETEMAHTPLSVTCETEEETVPFRNIIHELIDKTIKLVDEALEVYDDKIARDSTFTLVEENFKLIWKNRKQANDHFRGVLVYLLTAVRNSFYQNYEMEQYESIKTVLEKILEKENGCKENVCEENTKILDLVVTSSGGDLRKAINFLECMCRGNSAALHDESAFYSTFDIPNIIVLERFVQSVLLGNITDAADILKLLVDEACFNVFDVVGQLFNVIIKLDNEIAVRLMKPVVLCMSFLEQEASSIYLYDMLYRMTISLKKDMKFFKG